MSALASVEFRDLFRREREFGRGQIVVELLDGLGADDDAHHALALQKPGERDPRHGRTVGLGDRGHRVDDVVGAFFVDRREIERRAPRIVVAALVAGEFAGEESAGERAPYHHPEALVLDHRHDLPLEFAPGDRVVGLDCLKPRESAFVGNAERLHYLPGGEVRAADRVDETAAHAIVERAQGLLKGRHGIKSVDLIEIHMIEPQPFQAARDLIHDVAARQADSVRPGPHAAANLGGDDNIFALNAEVTQRLADLNLGLAFGIDVGRIDEIRLPLRARGRRAWWRRSDRASRWRARSPAPPLKVIAPRHISETYWPVRPSGR